MPIHFGPHSAPFRLNIVYQCLSFIHVLSPFPFAKGVGVHSWANALNMKPLDSQLAPKVFSATAPRRILLRPPVVNPQAWQKVTWRVLLGTRERETLKDKGQRGEFRYVIFLIVFVTFGDRKAKHDVLFRTAGEIVHFGQNSGYDHYATLKPEVWLGLEFLVWQCDKNNLTLEEFLD